MMNRKDFYYYTAPAGRSASGAEAVIPLPWLGEGGPVYPGDDGAGEPVIPLPFPGEGGPVYPGDDGAGEPVIPLPDIGEGGPVYPGDGPVIQPPPQPATSRVRFLNAAYNYPSLRVSVANSRFASRLGYAAVTNYGRVRAGYQMVRVTGSNGRIYIQKTMPFSAGGLTTIAIINTAGGLDLLQINDSRCPASRGCSGFRVGNLAYNSGPLDVLMSDGRVIYSDLRFKEVAAFRRIVPGTYQFFYADTRLASMPPSLEIETMDPDWLGVYPPYETFGTLYLDVNPGECCTVYLLQNGSGRNNIQNLILVDR